MGRIEYIETMCGYVGLRVFMSPSYDALAIIALSFWQATKKKSQRKHPNRIARRSALVVSIKNGTHMWIPR